MLKWNFLYFNLYPLPLVLSLGTKSLTPSLFPLLRYQTVTPDQCQPYITTGQSTTAEPLLVQYHIMQDKIYAWKGEGKPGK